MVVLESSKRVGGRPLLPQRCQLPAISILILTHLLGDSR